MPPERPSLPHSMHHPRARDEGARADEIASGVSEEIARTLREAGASGLTLETVFKLLDISQRRAIIAAKQDDRLNVAVEVSALKSQIGTLQARRTPKEKAYRVTTWFLTASYVASAIVVLIVRWTGQAVLSGDASARESAPVEWPDPSSNAFPSRVQHGGSPASDPVDADSDLEHRVSANERRHDATDRAIEDMSMRLDANTRAVLDLAATIGSDGFLRRAPTRAKTQR